MSDGEYNETDDQRSSPTKEVKRPPPGQTLLGRNHPFAAIGQNLAGFFLNGTNPYSLYHPTHGAGPVLTLTDPRTAGKKAVTT